MSCAEYGIPPLSEIFRQSSPIVQRIFKLERFGRDMVSLAKPHEILKETKPEDLQVRRRHGNGYPNISEGPSRAGS
jgi:hypothetical protein